MDERPFDAEQIDALVFDVVGTLVDEDTAWRNAAARVATAAGLTDSTELARRWAALLAARMDAVVDGTEPWRAHRGLVAEAAVDAVTALGGAGSPGIGSLAGSVDREYRAWPEVSAATETLSLDPARALFVAAHPWDLRAAARHGFRTAYLARPGAERPGAGDRVDLAVDDLAALVLRLGARSG